MRANSLDLKKVSIHDSFWSKHVDLVRNAIIPYQWEAMNDRIPDAESSHCLENFKIAAGRAPLLLFCAAHEQNFQICFFLLCSQFKCLSLLPSMACERVHEDTDPSGIS